MGAAAARLSAAFVVSTGDNVYESGITSATDQTWKRTFTDVYTHPALLSLPFYAVMGNHDWYGNVTAQVSPLGVRVADTRWRGEMSFSNAPGGGQTDHWPAGTPAGTTAPPLLSLFYVDTSPWVVEYRTGGRMDWVAAGVLPADALRTAGGAAIAWAAWESAQLARLTGALAASSARWKVVVGHHGIYSQAAGHGSQLELTRLNAVLRAGGAAAYINGHDHDLQLMERPPGAGAPVYLTSGAGSQCRDDVVDPRDGSMLFSYGFAGFNAVSVTRDALSITSFDKGGAPLHNYTQAWAPPPACGGGSADPRCSAPAPAG
jgi:hypothetical protein